MARNIRQQEIYRLVQVKGACSIAELARELDVSGETIRRNVKDLVQEGLIVKSHGGISLPSHNQEPPIINRMQRKVEEKKRIAEAVSSRVEDGDSIIIDTGSTTAFCAQALRAHSNLTVVTNSSYIANLLATRNENRVFMVGGELRAHDAAAFGSHAIEFVENFHAEKCILSIGAIHSDRGCMNFELCEAEFSRAVLKHSDYAILASDSSKFGRTGIARVCGFDGINLLVTDEIPNAPLDTRFGDADVEVLVA